MSSGIAPALAQLSQAEHFETRVRPVLVRACQGCHGVDKAAGGLRLDSREAVLRGGKRGPAMIPGNPAASLIVRAIRHDGELAMPMGGSKLKDLEIAAVVEWVAAGAAWPASAVASPRVADWYDRAAKTHWAFQPVRTNVTPPATLRDTAWPRNGVDRFVLAALEAKKLAPARAADKRTLIRRASLVLTGLPPSPAEIDRFVQDSAPGAFDRAVARLIDSAHFGEHWARHWMDVVRYGETRGYEWNYEIAGAWRYRDYLVRAFNDDVPFDQLVREHIAGDLLDRPRINAREGINESVAGTAFFRLGEAGHDDCIQFREISLDVVDNQIDTLGKAFQGLTLGCARCHNHKLDPIPTSDYYGLFGVLNSSRAVTHTLDAGRDFAAERRELVNRKSDIRAELARLWLDAAQKMTLPLTAAPRKTAFDDPLFPWLAMMRTETERFTAVWRDLSAFYQRETEQRKKFNAETFTPFADFTHGPGGWFADGLGLRWDASARAGEITVAIEGESALTAVLPAGMHTNLYTDRWNGALRSPLLPKERKYLSLRLMGGQLAARRTVLDNCAIGEGYRPIETNSPHWVRLDTIAGQKLPAFVEVITKSDNPRIPDRPGVLKNSPAEISSPRSHFGVMRAVLHDSPETPREELEHLKPLWRDPAPASLVQLEQRYREITLAAVRAWADGRAQDRDVRWLNTLLRAGLLPNQAAASPQLSELIRAYRQHESAALPTPRVIEGLGDAGPGFDTPVLITGNPHAPGPAAPRHFLSKVGPHADTPLSAGAGSGRRELAERIADPGNPLTARVLVNRVWKHLFGRGLVATVDNFGREGEPPSHPELLDWLAARFMRDGWSVKRLVKLLATSQTFQQASEGSTAPAREADPGNTLLHHYASRRMPAETLRDTILHAAGSLSGHLYGPSIPPHRTEPQDYRRLFSGPLDGEGRRSLYTQITRMEGPRFLEIFDYPNPMAARGSRDITNVPAQALAMLNDPFVVDQARAWGERLVRDSSGDAPARVDAMFHAALGRSATEAERQRFAGLAREVASLRGVSPENLLSDAGVWKDVAHALFNLKEFLYIR